MSRQGRSGLAAWLVAACAASGCSGAKTMAPITGEPDAGAGADSGAVAPRDGGSDTSMINGCSDLFDENVLQTYSIEISADEWTKLDAEFHDIADVLAGTPVENYHPVVFHFGAETVNNVYIRLKGQSSWVNTVMFDANPKMQFVIAFDQLDSTARFHGVDKIRLDMPRDDWTFLNERIAQNWFREIGIAAPCANSARLEINGAYYGLYTAEGKDDAGVLAEFYPGNSDGDLFKGGTLAETNKKTFNGNRLQQFWNAKDIGAVASIVDLPHSVLEWAAEAVLDDADGYYGGSHNFFIYDQGPAGYVWLPTDIDTSLEWTELFQNLSYRQHPIYWWEGRMFADIPGQHYMTVMGDPHWRAEYTNAIETQVGKWNVSEVTGWLDAWSAQVADAVAADPHKWATIDQFHSAVAASRDVIINRPVFLQSFVSCERGPRIIGDDKDGDGVPWCDDCRDDNGAVHPGAPEICGNGIDDDCNGLVDDGCPP